MNAEDQIPRLKDHDYKVTSQRTPTYNCFAWALGDTSRVIAPVPVGSGNYWPPGIPQWDTLSAYKALFELEGFAECDSADHEDGFERIAIYVKDGEPTHAARQLSDGGWTSKLGANVDIAHPDLEAVGGTEKMGYGDVALVMKRPAEGREPLPSGVGDVRLSVIERARAVAGRVRRD